MHLSIIYLSQDVQKVKTGFVAWCSGHCLTTGFPGGSDSKESTCSAGDLGLIPG